MSSVNDGGQGWQVCDCSCHDQPKVVRESVDDFAVDMHDFFCCEWCDICGERIAGDMAAHLNERHQVHRHGRGG